MTRPTRTEIERAAKDGHAFERSDMREVQLPGAMLVGIHLAWSDLDGANLEKSDLSGADLTGASLREAYLAGAKLVDANLRKADLDGAILSGADLTGADLSRANLSGAILDGANLQGAKLRYAQLDGAVLGKANLTGANFSHADLDEADLGGVRARNANFNRATLRGAKFEEAQLGQANFEQVIAAGIVLTRASLKEAILLDADLENAQMEGCMLEAADLRRAVLTGAVVEGVTLTGAKIHGLEIGSELPASVVIEWADSSPEGDGSSLLDVRQARRMLGSAAEPPRLERQRQERFLGRGDVLRNAELEFGEGASVEVESHLEDCALRLSPETELVLGPDGVMQGCTISGGRVTIRGRFVEGERPGFIHPARLVVLASGVVEARVEQPQRPTQFAFERGCRLKLEIKQPIEGEEPGSA